MKYFDKKPTGRDAIKVLPKRTIGGIVYPEKIIGRKIRKKIICSGSPMNKIDLKMRKKYDRKEVKPIIKYYEVK